MNNSQIFLSSQRLLNKLCNLTSVTGSLSFVVGFTSFLTNHPRVFFLHIGFILLVIFVVFNILFIAINYFVERYSFDFFVIPKCKSGIHFDAIDVNESDRLARIYGVCPYCQCKLIIRKFRIEYDGELYIVDEASRLLAAKALTKQYSLPFKSQLIIEDLCSISNTKFSLILNSDHSYSIKEII